MKRFTVIFVAAVFIMMTVFKVYAQQDTSVPPLINYQGMLTDANGNPMNGTRTITFNIYDAANGGNLIWGPQIFDSVPLINGRFNVILGTTDTKGRLISEAFRAKDRYIGITVESNAEIAPRQQVLSAPYAITAHTIQGPDLYVDPNTGNVKVNADLELSGKLEPLDSIDLSELASRIKVDLINVCKSCPGTIGCGCQHPECPEGYIRTNYVSSDVSAPGTTNCGIGVLCRACYKITIE